jgi:hypothetical protein
MSTLAPAPTRATDTDLRVAAAHEQAAVAAASWARAQLNPAAQAAALAYLLGPAAADQTLVAPWMDEGAPLLYLRLHLLLAAGGSA